MVETERGIFIVGLFSIISFAIGGNTFGTVLLIITCILIIYYIVSIRKKKKHEKENREKEIAREKAEDLKLNTIIIPNYNKDLKELISKYGTPTKTFKFEQYNLENEIIAFEESKRIWICGKDLQMSDILKCSYVDDYSIVKGKIISSTKTNNGSMVKRAIVGDLLLGGAGAIIGGTTSQKTTITNQESDKVYHDYTIMINVNRLAEPIIRIHIGDNLRTVNEIMGLINVVINIK